ncbi:MAG: MATE family efflux transporter [Clostridia bacterium]|nr:MATE family efflux transporter [Clostridia bacterium]
MGLQKENKMGVMPINKLLLTMSLPMMASMLVMALYNVVDSIFVSRYSSDALTAVTLAFPYQNLMIAVATGTGVGVNALLSKSLGEKKFEKATKVANNAIFLAIVSFVVFVLLGLTTAEPFFRLQIQDETIIRYGADYFWICSVFSFGVFGAICFERLLVSTGKTVLTMVCQLTGAITNIILDPIFIFGLLGVPSMGVSGAAIATVIGQIAEMILAAILNIKCNREVKLSFKRIFSPSLHIIKQIYAVGLPSILMASIGSVMTFCMNKILGSFKEIENIAINIFGIYFKIQSFIFMPVFGLNNGMVPIVAYNYGAKCRARVTKTIRLSMFYAVGIMLVGLLIFQIFPEFLFSIFNSDSGELVRYGCRAFRIISLNFIIAGFCIVASSVFQALGNGVYSLIVSLARQLGILVPVAYLLSLFGNIDLVWIAFPIAETVSAVLCLIFFKKSLKKID